MQRKSPTSESDHPNRWIAGITAAVAVWGAILAAGAWRLNYDPRRPLIVFGCVLAFLGFWWTMLAVRSARMRRR
jgi:hypothetical protein